MLSKRAMEWASMSACVVCGVQTSLRRVIPDADWTRATGWTSRSGYDAEAVFGTEGWLAMCNLDQVLCDSCLEARGVERGLAPGWLDPPTLTPLS
jgi:hypothetical protein